MKNNKSLIGMLLAAGAAGIASFMANHYKAIARFNWESDKEEIAARDEEITRLQNELAATREAQPDEVEDEGTEE